ncbi:hypothetical protein CMT41_08515 [Colwellia sp. MT41]|uniref:hypothetical protein n=1 Tax=Colwellia sp. MT41 TaxID=58049 RepID=UPI000717760A|nr:hypothetical protein [Colwellia sp. MT41]ALO34750.1 hypothetical protein CMT41_08515 [Colwellia sp. MT41]
MQITAIKIPATIKLLRLFKSNLVLANALSLLIIAIHMGMSLSSGDFSILSAGGGLLSLISLLLFLSYTIPTDENEYLSYLKIIYPLDHEKGVLGEQKTTISLLQEERRSVLGNKLMSVQSYYLVWSIIGTLIWAYGGFLKTEHFQAIFNCGG